AAAAVTRRTADSPKSLPTCCLETFFSLARSRTIGRVAAALVLKGKEAPMAPSSSPGSLRRVVAVGSLLLPLAAAIPPPVRAPRPNIVFILTDDQRWDTIDQKHSVDGATPVMQNVTNLLVKKGVLFENHFVTTALCAPSRSSILSGKYAHTTGVHSNGGTDGGVGVFDDSSTIPVWLKAAGYRTGLFGKYLN